VFQKSDEEMLMEEDKKGGVEVFLHLLFPMRRRWAGCRLNTEEVETSVLISSFTGDFCQ